MTDVWGPAPVRSIGGKEYYVLFQDLFSHEERIYFLARKSEVFNHYKKYEAWLKVQRHGRVGILGCDEEVNSPVAPSPTISNTQVLLAT